MVNTFTAVIVSGGIGGAGVALLVNELLPAAPKLGPALERLNPAPAAPQHTRVAPGPATAQAQVGQWLVKRLPITLPRKDLDLLGLSAEEFLLNKTVLVLFGGCSPRPCSLRRGP
ncbi:hypothetical protein ABZT51_49195 [Streptomyces sp. NPDC005373]|uniref:hypothetical protein n=1 Tax=Streptomyces sp. NPDC005373 TaxID=3156879 RepID=UPI0033AF502B